MTKSAAYLEFESGFLKEAAADGCDVDFLKGLIAEADLVHEKWAETFDNIEKQYDPLFKLKLAGDIGYLLNARMMKQAEPDTEPAADPAVDPEVAATGATWGPWDTSIQNWMSKATNAMGLQNQTVGGGLIGMGGGGLLGLILGKLLGNPMLGLMLGSLGGAGIGALYRSGKLHELFGGAVADKVNEATEQHEATNPSSQQEPYHDDSNRYGLAASDPQLERAKAQLEGRASNLPTGANFPHLAQQPQVAQQPQEPQQPQVPTYTPPKVRLGQQAPPAPPQLSNPQDVIAARQNVRTSLRQGLATTQQNANLGSNNNVPSHVAPPPPNPTRQLQNYQWKTQYQPQSTATPNVPFSAHAPGLTKGSSYIAELEDFFKQSDVMPGMSYNANAPMAAPMPMQAKTTDPNPLLPPGAQQVIPPNQNITTPGGSVITTKKQVF